MERETVRLSTRLAPVLVAGILVGGLAGCGGGADDGSEIDVDRAAAAASELCPTSWDFVKAVGSAFNEAASDVADLPTAAERRARWLTALDDMEALVDGVAVDTERWAEDPVLAPLVNEVSRDVPAAQAAIDDIRTLFEERPDFDEERHQVRTQQVIIRVEKVIDLPKPDLAPNDPTGVLRAGFVLVPSCQHEVRDADDGVGRANG